MFRFPYFFLVLISFCILALTHPLAVVVQFLLKQVAGVGAFVRMAQIGILFRTRSLNFSWFTGVANPLDSCVLKFPKRQNREFSPLS